MSEEWKFTNWFEVPEGCRLDLADGGFINGSRRCRIATPKPKRELVVGKWYRDVNGFRRKCIALDGEGAWMTLVSAPNGASRFHAAAVVAFIDWSTPPRDEAPE